MPNLGCLRPVRDRCCPGQAGGAGVTANGGDEVSQQDPPALVAAPRSEGAALPRDPSAARMEEGLDLV